METGVIYLPLRRFSTDCIRTGFLMQIQRLLILQEEDLWKKRWINGAEKSEGIFYMKAQKSKREKGLEDVQGLTFLLTSMFLLVQFSPLECPLSSRALTFSHCTTSVQSPPSLHSLPNETNQYLSLPFLTAMADSFCTMPICNGLHGAEHFYYCSQGYPTCPTCILCSAQEHLDNRLSRG